jgi:hypothetical protein
MLLLASCGVTLDAQTVDDHLMIPKKTIFTGVLYSYDTWDEYWEGARKRVNGNIGTITTQNTTLLGNYGVTDRLNVMATVPYVWTRPSQGVLQGQKGFQDLTLAAKGTFFQRPFTKFGSLRAMGVVAGVLPMTDYTPDFQPLSIGLASKRISGRLILAFEAGAGWFLAASSAYTWRYDVTLDRPFYFTENQLFLTDQVDMPNVFDYAVTGGYMWRSGLMIPVTFSQQRTQGGGDIRRQDMPFVSNRMNYSKINGMVRYPLPWLRNVALWAGYGYTLNGRNVGQASTLTGGLLYTLSSER